MDGNNQPISLPQAPLPPPQPKKSAFLIIAVIIIVLILIPIVALIINQFNKKPAPTPPPQKTTMTGLEIAKQTALFLEKSIQTNGLTTFRYNCQRNASTNKGTCTPEKANKIDPYFGYVALAFWELSKRTGEDSYKKSATELIETALKECQNSDNFCFVSMSAFYTFYKATNDPRFKEAILVGAKEVDKQLSQEGSGSAKDTLANYVGRGQGGFRLGYLYDVTGDEKYLRKLKEITDRIIAGEFENSQANPTITLDNGLSVKPMSLLAAAHFYPNAYRASKDPKYLKAMEDLFSKYDFEKDVKAWSKTYYLDSDKKKYYLPNIMAALGLIELTDISPLPQKNLFKDAAFAVEQEALNFIWDNPQNQKYTGDFGFLSFADRERNDNRKSLNDTSLRILQFLKLDDYVFNVRGGI